jgi:Ca2+-binding EF-hand superfamily protein
MDIDIKANIKYIISSQEELERISGLTFRAADTDGSGFLDFGELEELFRDVALKLKIQPPTKEEVFRTMKALDTSKDGKVSEDEFPILIKVLLEMMLDFL